MAPLINAPWAIGGSLSSSCLCLQKVRGKSGTKENSKDKDSTAGQKKKKSYFLSSIMDQGTESTPAV